MRVQKYLYRSVKVVNFMNNIENNGIKSKRVQNVFKISFCFKNIFHPLQNVLKVQNENGQYKSSILYVFLLSNYIQRFFHVVPCC